METFQGAEYDKQLTLAGWDAAVGLRELIDERATPTTRSSETDEPGRRVLAPTQPSAKTRRTPS
jgi:hypothetical protein